MAKYQNPELEVQVKTLTIDSKNNDFDDFWSLKNKPKDSNIMEDKWSKIGDHQFKFKKLTK